MKNKKKALILTALVFPGLGHFYLERYKSAFVTIAITLSALILIFTEVLSKISSISDKIIAGELSADYLTIRKTLLEQHSDSQLIVICTAIIIGVWFTSIIDILRLKIQ